MLVGFAPNNLANKAIPYQSEEMLMQASWAIDEEDEVDTVEKEQLEKIWMR